MNDVSVVLVTYNSEHYIRTCLDALAEAQVRDVVVVDNNSHDSTRAILSEFSSLTVILNDTNRGYTQAVNQGVRATGTPYILVLNPDVEISADTIQVLVSELHTDPRVGIAAPKLVYPDGKLQYSCRRFPTFFTFLLRGLGCTEARAWMPRLLHRHLMTEYDHVQPLDVDWVLGACMLIRRDMLTSIGLLDESYFLYYSDIDLCLRANRAGWKVRYEPRATAIHQYGRVSAQNRLSNPATRSHIRSALRFFWRQLTKAV